MKKVFYTESEKETLELGCALAKNLHGGEIIVLEGDIGAGKTVFCKGLAHGLGITEIVTSPTYSINNIYDGKPSFYHFDFYRITNEEEAIALGLHEHFGDPDIVCAIEWAENIDQLLNKKKLIHVVIDKCSTTKRRLSIYPYEEKA